MSLDSGQQTVDFIGLVDARLAAGAAERDRNFWRALGFALLAHATLFISLEKAPPRHIGDANGREDAISVSLVSETDMREKFAEPAVASPPPSVPTPATPAPSETAPEPPVQAQAEPPAPEPAKPEPETRSPQSDAAALLRGTEAPDVFSIEAPQAPSAKAEPSKPKPAAPKHTESTQIAPKTPPQKMSKLDLNPHVDPMTPSSAAGGPAAGFSRPPGITRSGANNDFGRAVIKALNQTMPPHHGVFGSVTIRILLSPSGDVTDVQIVWPSAESLINQEVVFAAKTTTYPFPPNGSTPADRNFLVTYHYR